MNLNVYIFELITTKYLASFKTEPSGLINKIIYSRKHNFINTFII